MSRRHKNNNFPQPQSRNNAQLTKLAASKTETFSGPLPHPELLCRYNDAVPGGAERILAMAENQSGHRQQLENKVAKAQIMISHIGQVFALLIAFGCLFGAVLCAYFKQPWPASVLGGASLVGSISAFMTGKKQKDKAFVQDHKG